MTFDNHAPTAELQALDAAHHIHPFTDTAALNKKGARVITRADGVFLWDSDGKRLLDAMSGLWCVNVGYGRRELVEAAARQMAQLPYYNTFFQTTHPPVIALSKKIADLAPEGMNHVFYAGSGSEANDTNVRMVRHYWASLGKPEKKVVIARKNAYHGSTMAGASLGGMGAMHSQGGLPIPDIHHIDQPYWYREGGDMTPAEFGLARARALGEAIDRIGPERVAAFIAEPIQGAGAVIVPPETYWPEVSRILAEREILFIADEVICGFGRTGSWWGSTTYGLKPDIITIAKALTSGYLPMGGSIVSDHVAQVISDSGEFFHGYTYSGHPVCAAVALENLRLLDEGGLAARAWTDAAPYLAKRWAELGAHPLVGETRIQGMMGALELTPDKATRAPFAAPDGTVGYMCREHCFKNGLVMRHVRDAMIISPPFVITHDEIDEFIALATKSLDDTLAEVTAAGLIRAGR